MPAPPGPQSSPVIDHSQMDHGTMPMPAEQPPVGTAPTPTDHSQIDHAAGDMPMEGMEHGAHGMATTGALGPYPMVREASGTAWQPDASEHAGLMTSVGDWTLMAHGMLNLVYDHQGSRRGDDKAFASGMLMPAARSASAPCS